MTGVRVCVAESKSVAVQLESFCYDHSGCGKFQESCRLMADGVKVCTLIHVSNPAPGAVNGIKGFHSEGTRIQALRLRDYDRLFCLTVVPSGISTLASGYDKRCR